MMEPTPKPAGTWDFYGACAPSEDGGIPRTEMQTFTLGCFQWVPFARGKGTKRGAVQYRVKGRYEDPSPAFNTARAYCAKKNAARAKVDEAQG